MNWSIDTLDDATLNRIHDQAVDLLSRYGIQLMSGAARGILADHGADTQNGLVRIPAALTEKALSSLKDRFTVGARNPEHSISIGREYPPVYGPACGMVLVYDYENGRRSATMADHASLMKLTQTSRHVNIASAGTVYPTDIDLNRGLYLQMLQAIEMSDKPLLGLTQDGRMAADTIEMARMATAGRHEHFVIGVVDALSPMAWDEHMLDAIMAFAGKNQPCIITSCSMAGISSHIRLGDTLVQNHAEVLAGMILSQLVRPGAPVLYGNTTSVGDMKTMSLALGAPELPLLVNASVQLARMLKVPCRTGGGLTDAKVLDAQAGVEAAMNLLFTHMSNPDLVLQGIGVMESFSSISFDKWIMDEEILERMLRMERGIRPPDEATVDTIGAMGHRGSYLMHPSTLAGCRTEHFAPVLADRAPYSQWAKKGLPLEARTTARWKSRLEAYEPPPLDETIRRELEAMVAERMAAR